MDSLLLGVAVLACPVGMGFMMWMMSRGDRKPNVQPATDDYGQIAQLRADIEQLKADRTARAGQER